MSKGAASIVCGAMALVLTLGGMFLAGVPYLGALLAFGAPVLALMGIVYGGLGIRQAQATGGEQGAATTGLVLSILGFATGLVVALTCGLCNACVSASIGPAGRAAGEALAEAREAAEAARRRQLQRQPLSPVGPDLGAVLTDLSRRCAEGTLSVCVPADRELHFTDLRCEAGAACELEFTLVEAGTSSEGTVKVAEPDLLAGPDRYVPAVASGVTEWLTERAGAPMGP